MNIDGLISEMRGGDVHLSVIGGLLHVDAPSGAITPALKAKLKTHKAELIRALSVKKPCGWCGKYNFWRRTDLKNPPWVCSNCHPYYKSLKHEGNIEEITT